MGRRAGQIILFSLICLLLFGLLNHFLPTGADWHFTFYPATKAWLGGQPIYSAPAYGLFHAPWTVLWLTPLVWLGERAGEAALVLITILGIIAGWRYFARPLVGLARPISLALCLVNLHIFDLIIRGQVDVLCIFGLVLLYIGLKRDHASLVAAGWLMSIRPTEVALLLIFSLWWVYKHGYLWPALRLTGVGIIASLLIFGPTWPIRYYIAIRFLNPPMTSWLTTLWHAADTLHLSILWPTLIALLVAVTTLWVVWRYRPDLQMATAFLVAGSLIAMPYVLSYHYVALLIVAIPLLLKWRIWLALPLYALTLTPLLRIPLGVEFSWVDMCLPLTIWSLLLYRIWSERRTNMAQETLKPVLQP